MGLPGYAAGAFSVSIAAMRLLKRLLISTVLLAGVGFAVAWYLLNASLASLDGNVALAGLEERVVVERDGLGVTTIRGGTRADLARATGYVHAQERFFQMDLSRRQAAGELSALFGPVALDADKGFRLHRFRTRAGQVLAAAAEQDRELLSAYAEGVNAGLADLGARPWEYLILGNPPEPWRPEDSLLVLYSMFLELNDSNGSRETAFDLLDRTLPGPMVRFISPVGTEWDAPMRGQAHDATRIPGPEVFSVEREPGRVATAFVQGHLRSEAMPGSNNWAVAGSATADGHAIVANDMHLPLRVPNIFYRLRLERAGGPAVTGASLPGTPVIVAGSNGRVAWGFTNSYGDWTDVILLEVDPGDSRRYRTADGWQALECSEELIEVDGARVVAEKICETRWGPLLPPDDLGRSRALKWLPHEPQAVNIGLLAMETASGVNDAVAIANRIGIPPQNMVIADDQGRVAWTIAGRIPRRSGYDPSRPASWSGAGVGWVGWLDPEDYPRIIDPPGGRLWTANARVVDGTDLERLGDGGYALGARAKQIRDGLQGQDGLVVQNMLEIQLDDRATFFQRWRDLALGSVTDAAAVDDRRRAEFRRQLRDWDAAASKDSVGFRLVYEFRQRVLALLFEGLTDPVRAVDPEFSLDEGLRYGVGRQFEGPAWMLVTARPAHLLHAAFNSWEELFVAAVDATIESASAGGDSTFEPWGRRNVARIRHPLSGALPFAAEFLDMPAEALDGATHMPRVQQSAFGASERFAVSPGREEAGYFHMPTGQSGHPLSPFYKAGHDAWVRGEPTAFLPGAAVHELILSPGTR
jgi:penicillin amidase